MSDERLRIAPELSNDVVDVSKIVLFVVSTM